MSIPTDASSGQALTPPLRIVTDDDSSPQHTWPVADAVTKRDDMKLIDKMALLVMLSYANVALGWKVWASEKAIFARMGCDQKAGRKAISRLEAAGIIQVARQKTQNAPNNYFVDPVAAAHAPVHPDPEHPKADHPKTDAPVDPHRDHPVDPKTDAPVHPKADHEHTTQNIRSEHTTENKRGTSMRMRTSLSRGRETVDAPVRSRRRSRRGPILTLAAAHKIIDGIPKMLIDDLCRITDEHRKLGKGHFLELLADHVKFRGEGDWTEICWHTYKRALKGNVDPAWEHIQDPGMYVASIADDPSFRSDTEPYSEQAFLAAVKEHNLKMKERDGTT